MRPQVTESKIRPSIMRRPPLFRHTVTEKTPLFGDFKQTVAYFQKRLDNPAKIVYNVIADAETGVCVRRSTQEAEEAPLLRV